MVLSWRKNASAVGLGVDGSASDDIGPLAAGMAADMTMHDLHTVGLAGGALAARHNRLGRQRVAG